MASPQESVSMALFCDFENVALGVRDANYEKFDIKPVLERLLLKGSIVVKKAYCDWDRYKGFKAAMHEASFELIEIPHVRQTGKNSADIRLVVDALDLCYTKLHVDTFVIISGDSDFSPLVSKLRENAKKVIGVGVKNSTSDLLVANCDEFIFYDDLVREQQRAIAKREAREARDANASSSTGANAATAQAGKRGQDDDKQQAKQDSKQELESRKAKAIAIAVETFDALVSERGDSGKIWASILKNAIKRRKPDFSESYYGFRAFGSLLDEAQARGLLEVGRDEKSGAFVFRSAQNAINESLIPNDNGNESSSTAFDSVEETATVANAASGNASETASAPHQGQAPEGQNPRNRRNKSRRGKQRDANYEYAGNGGNNGNNGNNGNGNGSSTTLAPVDMAAGMTADTGNIAVEPAVADRTDALSISDAVPSEETARAVTELEAPQKSINRHRQAARSQAFRPVSELLAEAPAGKQSDDAPLKPEEIQAMLFDTPAQKTGESNDVTSTTENALAADADVTPAPRKRSPARQGRRTAATKHAAVLAEILDLENVAAAKLAAEQAPAGTVETATVNAQTGNDAASTSTGNTADAAPTDGASAAPVEGTEASSVEAKPRRRPAGERRTRKPTLPLLDE